jgi:hypothetical protein
VGLGLLVSALVSEGAKAPARESRDAWVGLTCHHVYEIANQGFVAEWLRIGRLDSRQYKNACSCQRYDKARHPFGVLTARSSNRFGLELFSVDGCTN